MLRDHCLFLKAVLCLAVCMLSSCGGGDDDYYALSDPGTMVIPEGTAPCGNPKFWPLSLESAKRPFIVHYRTADEEATARKVIALLESSWAIEIDELAYVPPPSDNGACGPDGNFDVFLWRGHSSCWVDVISEQTVTPWGGRASYMLLDPWGKYGGDTLPQTVGHEFSHASQAINDWHEIGVSFEMTSTFIEQRFGAACSECIFDFQAHPDWSLILDAGYATSWYMYGSALYLHFLRDYYFQGSERFIPELWRTARNSPQAPLVNSPNFVDALNAVLKPMNVSFESSVVDFARWRYYSGDRDDGKHFRVSPTPWAKSLQLPFMHEATLPVAAPIRLTATDYQIVQPPMLLGSAYVEIERGDDTQKSFALTLLAADIPGTRWSVQAVPGLTADSDGDPVDVGQPQARVAFTPEGKRTLIITLLPSANFDPNKQTGEKYPIALRLRP